MMRRNFKKKFFCVVIFKKLHYLCGTIRLMEQGLVIKNTGSWYIVRTPDGTERNCKIKGNLRLKGFRCTNPVAVGDNVEIEVKEDGTAFIRSILPRRNYIIRRASNLSREFQILAANLDMAVLVVTLVNPETSPVFIDRFLATAEAYQVPVTIVFNKIDLLAQPEDRQLLDAIIYLYRSIGYTVVPMSVMTGEGLDLLREQLRGEMLDLPGDGAGHIIDTPGVKGFGTIDFEKSEVAHFFPEIFKVSKECKYNNCTHTHEPGCAVREAVEQSRISQSRYNSYLSIIDDANPDKYRKPF